MTRKDYIDLESLPTFLYNRWHEILGDDIEEQAPSKIGELADNFAYEPEL